MRVFGRFPSLFFKFKREEELAEMNGLICFISLVLFGSVNSGVSDKNIVLGSNILHKYLFLIRML